MNGFIFRVCAYHGEPVVMNGSGLRARSGLIVDSPVPGERVINDPNNDVVKDVGNEGRESKYDISTLIQDFEDEYDCKVNFEFDILHGRTPGELDIFQFDVFEPSWPDEDEAKDVIDDLSDRLVDWAEGFPTGR